MRTNTAEAIIKMIRQRGPVRPEEVRREFDISANTVHYHLRNLVKKGLIEAQGEVPFTRYRLAGAPDLAAVSKWINATSIAQNPESVCETRDTFNARLPRLQSYLENGLPPEILPLVLTTSGELGNNSFDHNLGQWRDVPGCWFETQVTGNKLWIWIGDRGQGIYHSLSKAHPEIKDEQLALKMAFETIISGRAPEQRGNGLKFVKNSLSEKPGRGVGCLSGIGRIQYGDLGPECLASLEKYFSAVRGTITLCVWSLQ